MRSVNVTAGKLILLMRALDASVAQFQDAAASACKNSPFLGAASELGLCRIVPAPEGLPRRPDDPADPRPPYDVAILAKFHTDVEAQAAFAASQQLMPGVAPHAFLVTEIPVLDRLGPGQRPVLKNLALIVFHEDMPDSAAKRGWAQHAKLAQIIHVGAGRYVRNWVERRSEDAPPVRGIVEIDFATVTDLVERYFGVPGGMERVIQDTGHFVQRAQRLYMREERLRP